MSALTASFTPRSAVEDGVLLAFEAEIKTPGLDALLFRRTVTEPSPAHHWRSDQHNLFMALSGPIPGQVHLSSKGVKERLPIGELFFLPADKPFHFSGEPGACTRTVLLRFDRDYLDGLAGTPWSADDPEHCFDIRNTQLRAAMFRIAQELVAPGFAGGALVEGLAMAAGVDAMRHLGGGRDMDDQPLVACRLRRITEYLEESGAPSPSLTELAGLFGISPSYLSRAFRKATGMTIHRYIEEVRLRSAQTLLATTDLKLKEVAFRLGFARASSFTVAFRRAAGETPIGYRRRMRGDG